MANTENRFNPGDKVRIIVAGNPREQVAKGLVGVVTDVFGGTKCLVTFLTRTRVGSIEEYSIMLYTDNIELVQTANTSGIPPLDDTDPLRYKVRELQGDESMLTSKHKTVYSGTQEEPYQPPFHFLERQSNRFTFWLISNGYHRYLFISSLYGDVIVWAGSKEEAEEYMNGQVKLDFPDRNVNCYATKETLNLKGVTFEKHDRFVEKKFTGSLNA